MAPFSWYLLLLQALWLWCLLVIASFSSVLLHSEAAQYGTHQNFGKYHKAHLPSHKGKAANYSPHAPKASPLHKNGSTLAVEGVVVCQNCKHLNTRSLQDATPLPGAKVRLACRDMRFKTFVYDTAYTNKQGYFLILVEDFDFKKHKGVRSCRVYLVSSPHNSCAQATNINAGMIGSPLATRQKVYYTEILYSVGPFAFAPPSSSCKKP